MSNGPYIVDETCLVFAKNIETENEDLRAEIEKLHREAAIRIDQIERDQEAHLKTMADFNKQAEMNARLLTENASLRGEVEMLKINLPARAATRGLAEQHNEITRLRAENEKLREALTDAAGELQHAYIMGFTERYRDAAKAARAAVAAIRESGE